MIHFGNLNAEVFVADSIRIQPGTKDMAVGFALVAFDFVVPEVGECQTLHAASSTGLFQVGDYLLIRTLNSERAVPEVNNAWFKITRMFAPNPIWSLEHIHGGKIGMVIKAGCTLVNFGQPTTGGPSSEPEPSRTVEPVPPQPNTFNPTPQLAQSASAWQCPGCGTYYAYWISKCECQKRRWIRSSNTITFTPFETRTG